VSGHAAKDFADEHIELGQRIRNLQVGVTKPTARLGGYGRNTNWHQFGLKNGMGGVGTKVYWRVRSDWVHFRMEGAALVAPASQTNAMGRLGQAAWPSHEMLFPAADGVTLLRVDPDGFLYRWAGTAGSFRIGRGYPIG
jgi:hypothetical protein